MSGGQMATFFDAVTNWFGRVASIGGKVRVAEPGLYQANGQPADADDMLSINQPYIVPSSEDTLVGGRYEDRPASRRSLFRRHSSFPLRKQRRPTRC
jgi:hypothetical protein